MLNPNYYLEIEKEIVPAKLVNGEIVPAVMGTVKYDRAFIEKQIVDITSQRDEQLRIQNEIVMAKERELKEVQDILAEMDKQNVISLPIPTNE